MQVNKSTRTCHSGRRISRAPWLGVCSLPRARPVGSRRQQCTRTQAIGIEDLRHVTVDGQGLELLLARPFTDNEEANKRPPLLFVHGSYHGAWCWKEKFLPYFADRGYNAYAISMRGQGGSDIPVEPGVMDKLVAGTMDTHAKDISDLIAMFPVPPIIVAHSFGGLIAMSYLLKMSKTGQSDGSDGFPPISGVALLCSVPPSGNKNMIGRFFKKDFILSLKVTWGFIAKSFVKDTNACRDLFFSKDLPEADLLKYQRQLAKCSPIRLIDLQDVNKRVPLPPVPQNCPPAFVLGGEDDVVVDAEAVVETAEYFGVNPRVIKGLAHDCMLDTKWEQVASELEEWLKTVVK